MTTVLFWDIDGTLLTTGRAGIFAWEDAAREVVGRSFDLDDFPTAGLTDVEVAAAVLSLLSAPQSLAVPFLKRYEELLPASLPRKQGRVLPGVRELLTAAEERKDVLSLLLTGNTRAGARAKLGHYGLDGFFPDGAFSDGTTSRADIARNALALARRLRPDAAEDRMFVIGDTPHDVACARAIGVRCVGVAFPPNKAEGLAAAGAWWALDALPSPAEFFAKAGLS